MAKKPTDDGLLGLTVFPETGECVKTTSKSKSTEIGIFEVVEPNKALGNIKNYNDKKLNAITQQVSQQIVVRLLLQTMLR